MKPPPFLEYIPPLTLIGFLASIPLTVIGADVTTVLSGRFDRSMKRNWAGTVSAATAQGSINS